MSTRTLAVTETARDARARPAGREHFPDRITTPNNFDALRFLLAVLVIWHHSFPLTGGANVEDGLGALTRGVTDYGSLAVDLFFVISGFLIAGSWQNSSSGGSYLKKRSLRIFPGLFVVVFLCVFVVGPLSGVGLRGYFHDPRTYGFLRMALLHANVHTLPGVFLQNPFPGEVNGSLWTIEYEFLCYLLLAFLGLSGALNRRWPALLLLGACWISVAYFQFQPSVRLPWLGYLPAMPRFALFFLTGTALYLWRSAIPRSPALLAGALLLLALTCRTNALLWTLPLMGYVVLYLAYDPRIPLQRFARRGDLSYGVYLYGFPIQQLLVSLQHGRVGPLILFWETVPLTICCAALSWHFVEHPFLRLKKKPTRSVE